MNKDAPAIPAGQSGVSLFSRIVRGKAWKWTLSLGATAGIAMGILNLLVTATDCRLQGYFDTLSYPAIFLTYVANDRLGFMNGKSSGICEFYLLVAVICYWSLIGFFLASIPCLARDRTYRYVLSIGATGGWSMGCLKFMATVGGWDGVKPMRYFDIMGRSGTFIFSAHQIEVQILFSLLVVVVYWMVLGLCLASLFCVVRILTKRKAATGIQVSGESNHVAQIRGCP